MKGRDYEWFNQHEINLAHSDDQLSNAQKRAIDEAIGSVSGIACRLGLTREYVQAHICLMNLRSRQ